MPTAKALSKATMVIAAATMVIAADTMVMSADTMVMTTHIEAIVIACRLTVIVCSASDQATVKGSTVLSGIHMIQLAYMKAKFPSSAVVAVISA